MTVALRWDETGAGEACRSVLDALPDWFSIPEAVDEYVNVAQNSPTLVATDSSAAQVIGLLTLVSHSRWSAEIYVMGVLPGYHRRGIGRQLVAGAEDRLRRQGCEFLQVKTLSERHPDAGYAKTRSFYSACGFRALEEFPDLWGPQNPAVQLIKLVGTPVT